MSTWFTILGMACVTYVTRATMLLALRKEMAPWLRRWLDYVPVAVFAALILPQLLLRKQGDAQVLVLGPAIPAGIVAALVSWRTNNILLTIIAGLLMFWGLRWLGM
jgi:branched-subunit amino acid transport protein